jgi:hypothetical protein
LEAGELWRATGNDPYSKGIGVTFVREDGSGLSVSLGTAEYDRPPEGAGEPVSPPLSELPLTHAVLAEIVTTIAARGAVFQMDSLPQQLERLRSAKPDTWRPSPQGTETCPDGRTIVEAEDEFGVSSLVQVEGTTWVCASVDDTDGSAEHYVGPWRSQTTAPLTGEWIGPFPLETCGTRPCGPALWSVIGIAPAGVTQVSVVGPDGTTASANLVDRQWVLRTQRPTTDEVPGTLSAAVRGDTLTVTLQFEPTTWPTVESPENP